MNKSVSVQSVVEKDGENIAYMSSQISCSMDMFNMSIQIMDKDLYAQNKSLVKEKAEEFIRESFAEAVANGWDILKQ